MIMGGGFHVQNAMSHELAWKFGESCHTKSKHQGRKLSILITGHVIDATLVIPESELVHSGQICALVSCGWRISLWSQDRDPCKRVFPNGSLSLIACKKITACYAAINIVQLYKE